ncbi:IS66 family transposase [Burkholderia cenocepacia]|nr:IS66 family transposase [Burkholderia cenocepacia]MDI9689696.1 IS66 family transposase [Burkholderia cenocepacia]
MQIKPPAAPQTATPGSAAQLPQTVPECHAVITQLIERVKLLEERISLDSNNSSKPPSSNGPGSPNRAQRRASARKRGAQPGHKGHSRALLDEAELDSIVECKPAPVCECGAAVAPDGDAPRRHQVFDVPPMRAQVDEYRLYGGRCTGCGRAHAGVLPAGVPKGQLGVRALSLVGVLGTRYHLTQRKIRNLLDQLMGLSFSVGAISQAHGKVAHALKRPVAQAAASLGAAPALWMDETHYPREGIKNWVWAAVQPLLAVFAIYPSRARYVMLDFIGENCSAAITSDRYAGYACLDTERRQVCWAHLLRDFNRIGQRSGLPGRIGRRLLGLGLVMFRKRDQGRLDARAVQGLQRRVRQALECGAAQTACTRTANTCANVLKLWPALWGFTSNPILQPTNNAAEQALRSLVLKRKISGPTRSLRGDQFLARGFTAHESCLRQGRDLWEFMRQAVHAFIADTAPPSLMPQARPAGPVPTG